MPPEADEAKPQPSKSPSGFDGRATLRALGCGLAMGTADAVPGVSGGTIALILGIYERFIGSLADVVAIVRHPRDRVVWHRALAALRFLVPLGAGAVVALYAATKLLVGKSASPTEGTWRAMDAAYQTTPPTGWLVNPSTAPVVFAFFFGLVLLSVNEPWKAKRSSAPVDWLLLLIGAAVAASLGLSSPASGSTSPFALVAAGSVAISVMLLPGVSGSLALLVLGMYQIVTGAIHSVDLSTMSWSDDLSVISWFLGGIILGVVMFVPLLRWLLARVHDRTMSFLSGLMLGSLAALWPWKAHYLPKFIPYKGAMSPELPTGAWWGPVLAAVAGGALIVITSRLASRKSD